MNTRILDDEVAFFTVMNSADLWKELKKHMFLDSFSKKTTNFYNYRDGDTAAYYGYLGLIQESKQLTFTKNAIDNAAEKGYLPIIKFLHENRLEGCTTFAMDGAAGNGHLDIVKFLHHHRSEGCTTIAMDLAAKNGHLEIIKFLHHHRKEGCTEDAVVDAIINGHIEIVKYMYYNMGLPEEYCMIDSIECALEYEQLEIVKFLQEAYREED